MNIYSEQGLMLSDTLVPDVFISEYMAKVSPEATKVYLLLLLSEQKGSRQLEVNDLTVRLGFDENIVYKALTELQGEGLLTRNEYAIELSDIKTREVRKFLERERSGEVPPSDLNREDLDKRETIVSQINDTFFQGTMPLEFYTVVDRWFHDYRFEPEVVYAAFNEAHTRKRLNGPGYVAAIADNWGRDGVRTFEQLEEHYKRFEAMKAIETKIKKKLNLRGEMTEYQQALVRKWVEEMNYDFPIIDYAMSFTVGIRNPNMNYIDKILTRWHDNGLTSLGEIRETESRRRKTRGARQASRGTAHNFEARRYSEAEFDDVFEIDSMNDWAEDSHHED